MPLAGAYVADEHLGRFKTIMYSIGAALIGHTILLISAIPPVIKNPNGSIAAFAIGLVIMGVGTGGFKYATLPLIRIYLRKRTLTNNHSDPISLY